MKTLPLPIEVVTEFLAQADPAALITLAEACLDWYGAPVIVIPPETGLVMMQVREPVCEERFQLGEVLVTRCEVHLAGANGWAIRMGSDRVATLAAAICAAIAHTDQELAEEVYELCRSTGRRIAAERAAEWTELRTTEVAFEEMD